MKAKEIYNKIEFWLVSIIAASFILALLVASKDADAESAYHFKAYHIQFNFYKHFFLPGVAMVLLWYGTYISISHIASENKNPWTKAGMILGTFSITAIVFCVINTYLEGWKFGKFAARTDFYNDVFVDGFTSVGIIMIICISYYALKEFIFGVLEKYDRDRKDKGTTEKKSRVVTFLTIACWIALMIIFAANDSSEGVAFFGVAVPYIALLTWLHFSYLIPKAGVKRYKNKDYIISAIAITFLLSLLAAGLSMAISGNNEFAPIFFMFFFLTIIVLLPIIWYLSGSRQEKQELTTALGSSEASLGFLRSQINPHFLFNALNTLYGTALQEKAERTGEGIQKLGDMMRFMLHENTQEKISLTRELDYITNYIELQKLRTAASPYIIIKTNIEPQINRLDISPMLLIPFIENAFKHGISLQRPSFINISLHTTDNILFFDVNNSVHLKNDFDPEKTKSGIGLQNVKQRLSLLYPKKHELIIRESGKEFFVHLTVEL